MPVVKVEDRGGDPCQFFDLDVGYRLCTFAKDDPDEVQTIFDNIPNFKIREDDVLLSSYPKTGTTWSWEVISMLRSGKAERISEYKINYMIEATAEAVIDAQPSPRLLTSHLNFRFLPNAVKQANIKCVYIMRNPKDTAVSFYNHHKGFKFYEYDGKFENYLDWFLNGEVDYGSYVDHLLEWLAVKEREPEFPVHFMFYEDLKENGLEELKKLSRFLELPVREDLLSAILEKCSFAKMAQEKEHTVERRGNEYKPGFSSYRKGEIGDWKNWFTVAQSERFDTLWNAKMKGSGLSFRYSPTFQPTHATNGL